MNTFVTTEFSIYEIDMSANQVRRVHSEHDATANQQRYSADGGWQTFQSVEWCGDFLLFIWGVEDTDEGSCLRRT